MKKNRVILFILVAFVVIFLSTIYIFLKEDKDFIELTAEHEEYNYFSSLIDDEYINIRVTEEDYIDSLVKIDAKKAVDLAKIYILNQPLERLDNESFYVLYNSDRDTYQVFAMLKQGHSAYIIEINKKNGALILCYIGVH